MQNSFKTIYQHFLEVEDLGLSLIMLDNLNPTARNIKAETLDVAIIKGFRWKTSPQGGDFWEELTRELITSRLINSLNKK